MVAKHSSATFIAAVLAGLLADVASLRVSHAKSPSAKSPVLLALETSETGPPHNDFPRGPPIALAPLNEPFKGARLGNGPETKDTEGMRVRRDFSLTGRDMTVTAPNGTVLYSAKGDFWTMTSRTHFFEGEYRKELALVTKTFWTFRKVYEVHSYEPICPGQAPEDDTGTDGRKIYPFARLTEYLFSLLDRWSLERYNCDGTVTELWDIQSRLSSLWYYEFEVHHQGHIVGTMDQAYVFQMTPNYNVFVAKNEDRNLFAITATLVDMAHLQKSSNSSSSRRRRDNDHDWGGHNWGGGGGGNLGGGGGGAMPGRR